MSEDKMSGNAIACKINGVELEIITCTRRHPEKTTEVTGSGTALVDGIITLEEITTQHWLEGDIEGVLHASALAKIDPPKVDHNNVVALQIYLDDDTYDDMPTAKITNPEISGGAAGELKYRFHYKSQGAFTAAS